MFLCNNSGNFELSQYFNFETDFQKNENFFQKTGVPFFNRNTKIKKASLSYKTAISETSVKTNRMLSIKKGLLPVTTLFFRKF